MPKNPVPDPLTLWEAFDLLHVATRLVLEAWLQIPFAIVDEGERLANLR